MWGRRAEACLATQWRGNNQRKLPLQALWEGTHPAPDLQPWRTPLLPFQLGSLQLGEVTWLGSAEVAWGVVVKVPAVGKATVEGAQLRGAVHSSAAL